MRKRSSKKRQTDKQTDRQTADKRSKRNEAQETDPQTEQTAQRTHEQQTTGMMVIYVRAIGCVHRKCLKKNVVLRPVHNKGDIGRENVKVRVCFISVGDFLIIYRFGVKENL